MAEKMFVEPKISEEKWKGIAVINIVPEYSTKGIDLMKKGGKFYAVYNSKTGLWSLDPSDLDDIIDEKLYAKRNEIAKRDADGVYRNRNGVQVVVSDIEHSSSRKLAELNKWIYDLPPNKNYIQLDNDLTFKSDEVSLKDYRSKRLKYDLKEGPTTAYQNLMSVLYLPEEQEKLEWAIGSILAGESKQIDKMIVLYGKPGTGKSTVLWIIRQIFGDYCSTISIEDIVNKDRQFALETFKDNPLVAIQDDGSLAHITDTKINQIISHEVTVINEKNKSQYTMIPNALLFLATNERVDIHDTSQGITRRFIDVYPTGDKIPIERYRELKSQIKFEIPAIAYRCKKVYEELTMKRYINYRPEKMIRMSNPMINFIFEYYEEIVRSEYITLKDAYVYYRKFYEESGYGYPPKKLDFKEQFKEYFDEFVELENVDGKRVFNLYRGFKKSMLVYDPKNEKETKSKSWLEFKDRPSLYDISHRGYKAQYDTGDDSHPYKYGWDKCYTKLEDIDTSKQHWVLMQGNEIVIDFDIEEDGKKSFKKNFQAAKMWPETYAELSRSGEAIHLHYIYDGDPKELETMYGDHIEIKTFPKDKKSPLRRKLTKCNDIPIAHIDGTNLPKKKRKENSVLSQEDILTEQRLRSRIVNCLLKKHHGHTKPEVDYIKHSLDQIYASGQSYDVTDMRKDVMQFCMQSSHQRDACLQLLSQMKFCSDDVKNAADDSGDERPIIFFDIEVFPNLLLVCWKLAGSEHQVRRMFNPTASEIEDLVTKYRLIGFNNKSYDNQILYFRMMGGSIEGCYDLSQAIIVKKTAKPNYKAYALSYTDIYDYLVGDHRKGLKKIEIELGIHHQELDMDWDKPVPEDKWDLVADYCDNDVIATEAAFNAYKADFIAREILADISGLTVNDSTNSHTQQIIFGDVKNPQGEFANVDLSKEFPGYTFDCGKSWYRGEEPGEGGYVYAEPGIYYNVALLDIASMHPTSLEVLNLFGPYTKNFSALKQIRLYIKHGDFESAGAMFDGRLKKYLTNKEDAKNLSLALKIAINSVYGLTSASFANRCKPINNVDNVVAKRGALFMINLKHEVQERGFTVAHIKTDSIKIPNATPEIIQFVMEYGQKYGYTFEHEATYRKMALVNDAVYIAQYEDGHWTATGAQFQHPYVFKTLFSHEPLIFEDHVEVKSVTKGTIYLDMNEDLGPDEHRLKFVGRVGAIVPIKPGRGGGVAVRKDDPDDKLSAVTGTKGYRWLESEEVKVLKKEDAIDIDYFEELDRKAIENINKAGEPFGITFDDFVSEVAPDFMNKPE